MVPFLSSVITLAIFLYFSFTTQSVIDVDGNEVQANTKYYILPIQRGVGSGGGLALSTRDNRYPCPANVLQENDQNLNGFPLKIFPMDKKQVSVNTSTDINIVVMEATICVQRTVWQMGTIDQFTGRKYIRSNGAVGQPSQKTVSNWFKIEKGSQGYKIVFCPKSVCGSCRVVCGDVGMFVENGKRWLGLNGDPFDIVFKKVQYSNTNHD